MSEIWWEILLFHSAEVQKARAYRECKPWNRNRNRYWRCLSWLLSSKLLTWQCKHKKTWWNSSSNDDTVHSQLGRPHAWELEVPAHTFQYYWDKLHELLWSFSLQAVTVQNPNNKVSYLKTSLVHMYGKFRSINEHRMNLVQLPPFEISTKGLET